MHARLRDHPLIQNENPVRMPDRAQPVRDDEGRPIFEDRVHIALDRLLGFIVECACCFIE
jgi:hypothetical protein